MASTPLTSGPIGTSTRVSGRAFASIRATSSTSLTIVRMCAAASSIWLRAAAQRSPSRFKVPSSSVNPVIACSGVRSSWPSAQTKSVLARLAASALLRRSRSAARLPLMSRTFTDSARGVPSIPRIGETETARSRARPSTGRPGSAFSARWRTTPSRPRCGTRALGRRAGLRIAARCAPIAQRGCPSRRSTDP